MFSPLKVREGFLDIYHADESKLPTKVNLLTCQMKPVADDRLCFDVVSYNRTYHFQARMLPPSPSSFHFLPLIPTHCPLKMSFCKPFSKLKLEGDLDVFAADVRCSLKPLMGSHGA